MKTVIFAGVAALALVSAQFASAATVEVNVAATNFGQLKQGTTGQASGAINAVIGEVRNNAEATASAINGINMLDLEQVVADSDAAASATGSLSATMSAASSDVGNFSSLESGALGGSGLGITLAANYVDAASAAWSNQDSFSGALNTSYTTSLPSFDYDSSSLNVSQVIADASSQTANAVMGSGAVLDFSSTSSTAANLANQAGVKVSVGCNTCN